jgi:hypothetical protein
MKNNPFAPFWSPLWHHKSPKGFSEDELKSIDKLQANNDCENL